MAFSPSLSFLHLLFLLLIPLLILLFFHSTTKKKKSTSPNRKLPPTPPSLPLLGHLHHLSHHPHRSLRKLSSLHGPVTLLHLGQVPTVILSSASAVQEAIRHHDLALSNRAHSITADILTYGSSSVPFTQYGEYWRQARRVYAVHMLSVKQVESFRQLREEEVALFVERIRGEKVVNLSKLLVDLSKDIACRTTFGEKYSLEGDTGKLIQEVSNLFATIRIGEFIPWLSWIDRLRSIDNRAKATADILDRFLERVIQQQLQKRMDNCNRRDGKKMEAANFIKVLLDVKENDKEIGTSLSMENIKIFLWDMILAGTDTVHIAMEWVMAELIRHPDEMKRVQQEIRSIVHAHGMLDVDAIRKMVYLNAAINESFRLHPPVPLLVPRETTKEIELLGYHIPAKTRVIINAWAIGRDPDSWGNRAEDFLPERFMNNPVNYTGQDFQFIPFGVGRRGCPGMNYATGIVELVLANLLYHFDWQLPDGKSLDISETAGITVHLKNNLVLMIKPFV